MRLSSEVDMQMKGNFSGGREVLLNTRRRRAIANTETCHVRKHGLLRTPHERHEVGDILASSAWTQATEHGISERLTTSICGSGDPGRSQPWQSLEHSALHSAQSRSHFRQKRFSQIRNFSHPLRIRGDAVQPASSPELRLIAFDTT